MKLKFPPALEAGRLIVVLTDGKRDRLFERREDMIPGHWGEIHLPELPRRNRARRGSRGPRKQQ